MCQYCKDRVEDPVLIFFIFLFLSSSLFQISLHPEKGGKGMMRREGGEGGKEMMRGGNQEKGGV